MSKTRRLWIGALALGMIVTAGLPALAAEACCAKAEGSDAKADAKCACMDAFASEEGWVSLFNGKDLTGWQNARRPKGKNKWLVEDGCLTNMDHANNIGTTGEYKDFCLKLEYKIVAHGNSGTYLRGRVEIQILDSHGKEELNDGDDGGIYGQYVPKENASNPAGEWNKLEAMYCGDRLFARLNGKVVQDYVEIKGVTGGALPGDVNAAGPVMLQGDHGKIWFRNIAVKPLGSCDKAE